MTDRPGDATPATDRDLAEEWLADRWLVHSGAFAGQVTAWIEGPGGVRVKISSLAGSPQCRVAPIAQCCPIYRTRSLLDTEESNDA